MPSRYAYGTTPDIQALMQALLEQERNTRAGTVPSSDAFNRSLPRSGELEREAGMLGEMDRRYLQSREDDRKRRGLVSDAQAKSSVRDFETRTGVAEEPAVRKIRRFTDSATATDPDAALSVPQKAMLDPRVLAAKIDAGADVDKAKAGQQDADASRQELIRLAQELTDSPYLNANVGPLDEWLPTVRGGSRDFQAKAQRVRDLLSLEARSKMKGQGQISDFEGRMLANSQTSLNRGTDEASFKAELARIIAEQKKRGASSGVRRYNPATGMVE